MPSVTTLLHRPRLFGSLHLLTNETAPPDSILLYYALKEINEFYGVHIQDSKVEAPSKINFPTSRMYSK
jgi:hypothetical protein